MKLIRKPSMTAAEPTGSICRPRMVILRLVALVGLGLTTLLPAESLLAETHKSPANSSAVPRTPDTTKLVVGTFTMEVPGSWHVSTGEEAEQLKAEIKGGVDQMISQYRAETGQEPRWLGIQDFKALRLGNASGWCIIHVMRIPPVKDYYERMKEDTRQKLEWGLQRGVFEKVIENGVATIGQSSVMKSILQMKGGGRMIQIAHWSPSDPGLVSQIMIWQNSGDTKLTEEVDAAIRSVAVKAVEK
jgi:hypothetical protein